MSSRRRRPGREKSYVQIVPWSQCEEPPDVVDDYPQAKDWREEVKDDDVPSTLKFPACEPNPWVLRLIKLAHFISTVSFVIGMVLAPFLIFLMVLFIAAAMSSGGNMRREDK